MTISQSSGTVSWPFQTTSTCQTTILLKENPLKENLLKENLLKENPLKGTFSRGPSRGESSQGDGAARVPLSEAIGAVLDVIDIDVIDKCASDLTAVRHRLRRQELPKELSVDDSDLPRPDEQARHIAARLETCAGALRNASGEVGDQPGLPPGE